ncbi:MAG: hypothetical protein CM1200mP2_28240 [Planctomycetaceae bacterium]|nr:MAG: hypothetical protein CM1200mP2_28240 [Planctomycetaceae bacterium]
MSSIDPIKFEVIRNAFVEVTEEMSAALRRSAYSTNIKTRCDFSCAIFDRNLNVLAQSFAQANHLGSLVRMVPLAVEAYGAENFNPGDGIVLNDPFLGGVHLNDITIISPVYSEANSSGTWPAWPITSTLVAERRQASGPSRKSTRKA